MRIKKNINLGIIGGFNINFCWTNSIRIVWQTLQTESKEKAPLILQDRDLWCIVYYMYIQM